MNGQTLMEKIRALPPERIAEVEDFVDFLRQREIMSPNIDLNWSVEMREVVSELRHGATGCSDEEIEDIVCEALEAVRTEEASRDRYQPFCQRHLRQEFPGRKTSGFLDKAGV